MRTILLEVSPLLNGVPTAVRLCGTASGSATTQLNGVPWLPCITKRHTRSRNFGRDGVLSPIDTSWGSVEFWLNKDFGNETWGGYEWSGAAARIFVGEEGQPFASYTQQFEGNVSSLDRTGNKATIALLGPESSLTVPLLNLTYGGTGGADGMVSMKGTLKPRAFGTCETVAPVLVDGAKYIYQVHGYGPVSAIPYVYEFAQAFDSAKFKGDVASYDTLAALTLLPAEYATCLAQGMFRIGGAPREKISADVVVGNTDVATIARVMLGVAGIQPANIGNLSIFSGTNWSLYLTDQAEVLDTVRNMVFQAGGYIYADGTGIWQVGDYYAPQTAIVLNDDRSTFPLVRSIKELNANGPVYKASVGYRRCWNVHSEGEVSPALAQISDAQIAAAAQTAAALELAQQVRDDSKVAKDRLDAIVNDGILDRSEKVQLVQTFSAESAQQTGLQNQSTNVDVRFERAILSDAFANLRSYLEGLAPSYTNTTLDTPIDRAAFDARWRDYWLAKQNLLNALAGRSGFTATWDGTTGPNKPQDNATVGAPVGTNVGGRPVVQLLSDTDQAKADAAKAALDAANAKTAADQAAADTVAAKLRLTAIEADGILDRSEKADVVLRFANATAERMGLLNKGAEFSLSVERTAYSDAYDALVSYLNALNPAYNDSTQDTPIDRAAFNAVWTRYFTSRQDLLNAIYTKTRTAAEAAQANSDKAAADAAAAKLAADAAKVAADAAKAAADATTANFTAARLTQLLQKPIDDIAKVTLDYGAQSLTTSKDLFDRNERSVRNLETLILNEDGTIRIEKISELSARIAAGVAGEATIRDAQIKDVKRLYQAGDAIVAADISTLGGRITKEVGDVKTAYEGAIRDTRQAVIDGDYAQALRADALSASITGLVQPGGNIYNLEAAVQRIDKAEVDNNGARAQETLNLKARLDNVNGASLEQSFTTYANKVDGIGAQYVLKVQSEANGVVAVAGMGLASSNGKSAVVFNADAFQINVPGAGTMPVFQADAQGVYMPNVRADNIKAGAIDFEFINKQSLLDPAGGYQALPGGMYMMWGRYRQTIRNEAVFYVSFPIAFPSICLSFQATPYLNTFNNERDLWIQIIGQPSQYGASVATQAARRDDQYLDGFDWFAIGR